MTFAMDSVRVLRDRKRHGKDGQRDIKYLEPPFIRDLVPLLARTNFNAERSRARDN